MTPTDIYPEPYLSYLFSQVDKNDPESMILLANIYEDGIVVEYYPEEAAWLRNRALEC